MEESTMIWRDRKHFLWFPFSFTKYWIEDESLYIEQGLLSTRMDETLLYRVTDITLQRSLGQKLCGTGTLILQTKIDSSSELMLENIKNPYETRKLISKLVEEIRERRNIVGKEFYGAGHSGGTDSDGESDTDFEE